MNKATSISAACAYPEIALEWLNTTYTEEGIIYSNYGLEGEAFTYDENGEPQYTDLIRNNPTGLTEQQARWLYCGTLMPLYSIEERNFDSYSDVALDAITNVWVNNVDSTYVYHGDLTADEAVGLMNTLKAQAEEVILAELILD